MVRQPVMNWPKFIPFLIFLITACVFGFFSFFYVDLPHDGIVYKPAVDVATGKILFKETFTQYGAVFTLIHATGLKLFGQHILTVRLVTVAFYCFIAFLNWHIFKRLLPWRWNLLLFLFWLSLSPVYWWYFHSWSSVQAAFFQMLSLLLLLKYLEQGKAWHVMTAMAISVLVFWIRQPVGVVHTLAMLLVLGTCLFLKIIPKHRRNISILASLFGVVLGFVPISLWLVIAGAWQDFWRQSILMPVPFAQVTRGITGMQIIKSLFMTRYWKHIGTHFIWLVIPFVTLGYFVYSSLALLKQRLNKSKTITIFAISVIGVASWHQYYPVTEPIHFFWAVTPMVGLLLVGFYTLSLRFSVSFQRIILLSAFVFVIGLQLANVRKGIAWISPATTTTLSLSIAQGIRMQPFQAKFFDDLMARMNMYFTYYPDKTYINASDSSFYGLFRPDKFQAFNGVFVDWQSVSSSIYPNLVQDRAAYVRLYRPLIFSRFPEQWPDYCELVVPSLDDAPIRLLFPNEQFLSLRLTPLRYQLICPSVVVQ